MASKTLPIAVAAPLDDAALVERVRVGDERAFAALYRRHARYVAGVVYRVMGDDTELDDVLQEAFTEASRGISNLNEPAQFRAWLARIAVRRVYRRLAARRRRRWMAAILAREAPTASDPRERTSVRHLYAALDALSPKLRVPWALHMVEGETLPNVARACEISLATAKRRIAEAGSLIHRRLHGS